LENLFQFFFLLSFWKKNQKKKGKKKKKEEKKIEKILVKFILRPKQRNMHSILALTETTRFVFLPNELLFHIISFNEKGAVELIQKKAKNMLKNKIRAFESMITFGYHSSLGLGGSAYSLFYNNRIVSREELVKTFSMCDCCERHKINRPKKLAPWVDTDFHDTVIRSCPCHCRQFSRFICREIN
jgi:hypothetical protein